MSNAIAFLQGVWEFRSSYTYQYFDWDQICAYERGRRIMHILTFGYFDRS